MQILVTGGAGFIRGHLAERLLNDGHDVTILDSMHPYYDLRLKERTIEICRETARERDGTYEFIEGDIRDADLVSELVSDAEFVYH